MDVTEYKFVLRIMDNDIACNDIVVRTVSVMSPCLFYKKRPRGRAVSAPDFGSRGRGFESRWRRDSSRTYTALHCTEPFMFTLPSSRND